MDTKNQQDIIHPSKGKKASTISIVNFSEADVPEVIETAYNEWILYGEDNLYPQQLILAWQQSAIHNALVNGISAMIGGENIIAENQPDTETLLKFNTFISRVNRNGDTMKDIIDRTAFDLYLQGYFAWELIWNQARTEIVEIYHLPAEGIRSGKFDEADNKIKYYYYSTNWEKYRQKKFHPKKIRAFDITDRSESRQVLFVKQYRPSQFYYSTPDYIGAMNWILLDNRVSEFHLNNIENGFFPSALIQFFNGEPPQAEKDAIESKFRTKFTGKASHKLVFVYNDTPETAVRFDTFEPARLDQRFRELMPEITQKIMVGHRVVSPMLFGIKDQTGWGNNADEIKNAFVLFNKVVIFPYQLVILRTLTKILRTNNLRIDISIETLQPAQFLEGTNPDESSAEVQMSKIAQDKRSVLSEDMIQPTLDQLKEKGKDIKELTDEGYVLVQVDEELTDEGRKLKVKKLSFAIQSDPEQPSSIDQGLYKIRYRYSGPRDEKNRRFCAEVLDMNLIFRKEDIDQMSFRSENSEFGTYSIFNYKGSYGCRHRWARLVFFKTGTRVATQIIPETRKIGVTELPSAFAPADDQATTKNPKPRKRGT
ncbi:hypothetical protein AMJ86_00800 [bacterium SM23_57]|nr:MAG: hypothetical protein AMJ86_00800 [bacterium SM23_57]